MADDVEINLRITGQSASAVTALNAVADGNKRLGDSISGLGTGATGAAAATGALAMSGGEVTRKFDKVALKLFNRELLDMMGYSGNASTVVKALSIAQTGLIGSIGGAVNAMFPYVAIIGTAVIIIEKITKNHKDRTTALEAESNAVAESYKKHDELIAKLEDYRKTVGKLTPELAELYNLETKQQRDDRTKKITELNSALLSNKEKIRDLTTAMNDNVAAMKSADELFKQTADPAYAQAYEAHKNKAAALKNQIDQLTDSQVRNGAELAAYTRKYAGVGDQIDKVTNKTKESIKTDDKKIESMRKLNQLADKLLKEELASQNKADKDEEEMRTKRNDAIASSLTIMSTLARSKNAELHAIGKASAISMAIVDTYAAANKALASVPPPWGFALAAGVITAGLANVSMMTAQHATGVDTIVSGPYPFIAGEGGQPERVTVTPLGGGGGGLDKGGGDTYHIGPFNVYDAKDPMVFAQKVMSYISQQTRGRGQIKPVGASIY